MIFTIEITLLKPIFTNCYKQDIYLDTNRKNVKLRHFSLSFTFWVVLQKLVSGREKWHGLNDWSKLNEIPLFLISVTNLKNTNIL